MDQEQIKEAKALILANIRVVGYALLGCSDCPFSSPSLDEFNRDDVNIADPDEGHYDCCLIDKKRIWGEDPICTSEDWGKFAFKEFDKGDCYG